MNQDNLIKLQDGGCILVLSKEEAIALCAIHGFRSGGPLSSDPPSVGYISIGTYEALDGAGYGRHGKYQDSYATYRSQINSFNTK